MRAFSWYARCIALPVHRLPILGALLLLQCGPIAPDADDDSTGATSSGGTTDIVDITTTTVADTTTATTTTATTTPEPTTTDTTTGLCDGVDEGNVWVCRCDTNAGPWTPFNDACSRGPADAIEWVEWLCENYADEPPATGTSDGEAGSTAGGETAGDETAGDTGSLGCMCTCEQTVECCDASKP